jgi:hypothetical protein
VRGEDVLTYFWLMPAAVTLALLVYTIIVIDEVPVSKWSLEDFGYVIAAAVIYPVGLRAVFIVVRSKWDE